MIFMNLLIVVTGSLFILPAAQAYFWQFSPASPQQCATASFVTYNHTEPILPLRLLVIPYGPLPLSDASKAIYEIPFNGPDPYSIDFQVKYPVGTQFIPLVNAILLYNPHITDLIEDLSIVQAKGPMSQASRLLSYLFLYYLVRILCMYIVAIPVTEHEYRYHYFPFIITFLCLAFLIYLICSSAICMDGVPPVQGDRPYPQIPPIIHLAEICRP